jgi:DNA-binding NarL/FixJ family response regulator
MTSSLRPRVVIADDHAQTLHVVSAMLREQFHVVAAVEDGDLVLDAVEQFHPELVILDICMPRLDGLSTARELRTKGFLGCIVFLTIQQDEDYLSAALALGARAYVIKSQMKADLLRAIHQALAGNTFVSS